MHIDNAQQTKLLKKAIKGDIEAFSVLLEANYTMIYHTAFKWIGNQTDAEDIAQEVCIKLGRAIRDFRMDSQFSTWLYRITINTVHDFRRKQTDHDALESIQDHTDMEQDVSVEVERIQIWSQVRQLPARQSDAVLLVYVEGLTHAEAAKVMECKESTVSWYIHEAKKQLKVVMQ